MRHKARAARGIIVSILMATSTTVVPGQVEYPETKKIDHADDYHGTKVADPYRWLEDDVRNSKDVSDWVEAENKVTFAYLEAIPERKAIEERLTKLWNFEKFSSPFKVGGRYYFYKNDGLQNQFVLYTQESLAAEPKVLIDPNEWSQDGTVALAGTAFSDDGRYVAYGVAESGSDWNTWRVMRIESREVLPDEIKWVKFSNTSWTKDGKGFFYSRYDEPPAGEKLQSLNHNQKVFYHRVGTPQADDVLAYARPDHPDWGFLSEVTEDGRYLVITVWKGTDDRFQVYYRDLEEPYASSVELIGNFDNDFSFIANDGPVFFFKTDVEAERRRVIAIDTRHPERENGKEIIPQAPEKLESVGVVGNLFIASYLKDARTQVKLYNLQGEFVRDVDFPGIITASGFSGKRTDTETFYSVQGFTNAPSIFRYDLISGKSTKMREAKVDADLGQYETSQLFYNSKDGTRRHSGDEPHADAVARPARFPRPL
jgi:prolyl oligopeptidase